MSFVVFLHFLDNRTYLVNYFVEEGKEAIFNLHITATITK